MKRRALTIVEVLMVVTFIGLITAAFYPILILEMKNTIRPYGVTRDAYEVQTLIENQKSLLDQNKHNTADWREMKVKTFGGHEIDVITTTVKTEEKDIGTDKKYQRDAIIILPKERVTKKEMPTISVSLNKSGGEYKGSVAYKSDADKKQMDFLVYRWYLTDLGSGPAPKKADPSKLVLIREHNIAKNLGHPRTFIKADQLKLSFEKEDVFYHDVLYEIIGASQYAYLDGNPPLVNDGVLVDELTGDRFKDKDLNYNGSASDQFKNDEKIKFYNNKGLVFSAMYVTKQGEVGEETYSDIVDLGYFKEDYIIGQSKTVEDLEHYYKAKFFLKQLHNRDKHKEYKILFRRQGDGTRFFPVWDNANNCYKLVRYVPVYPELKVDAEGYAEIEVLIPRAERLGIYFESGLDVCVGYVK